MVNEISGWWFGTWILVFYLLGIIIPTGRTHIFQRGSNHQPEYIVSLVRNHWIMVSLLPSILLDMWRTWAEENHDKAYLSSLTRASLGWSDANTFPNGQWAKGHVTTSLTEFFLDWANAQDLTADPLLGLCKEAALCIATALRVLYRSDVWLPKDVAHIIADDGLRFLSLYRILSVRS